MAKLRTEDIRTGMCFVDKTIMLLTLRRLHGGDGRNGRASGLVRLLTISQEAACGTLESP